eukprot:CAMPEP_0171224592 /NCGR_PEP_ID=MMETSP0790-20130122/36369_1 /TAXON_ID=2925 /ORGANISM="Alexandrium catenella, Strain OF101" /LENGTH=439 /DNA_ID=CAMNT_0011690595 /DNA_START=70 /DNA_END=1389 /DNA_ORIENTATION=+
MGLSNDFEVQKPEVSKHELLHDGSTCGLDLDISCLKLLATPVQNFVGNHPASLLGLGHSASDNLQLRKLLCKPGAPFGGMGLFDPQVAAASAPSLAGLTADDVKAAKLEEFRRCTRGEPSMYFWTLQPIFCVHDRAVAAEILVRAKNGTDSAPFEDVMAIMDPQAPGDVKQVYSEWKATEVVDFALKALKEHKVLQRLTFISTNVRPLDLSPHSQVFSEVSKKLNALADEDRRLLLSHVLVEVTEDQQHPENITEHIEEWQRLGFQFAADDTIGDMAAAALGKQQQNFHTTQAVDCVAEIFGLVKVDMAWAGHLLFLDHPSVASRPALKSEIIAHARDEDDVYMAAGPSLKKLNVKHSAVLAEFAEWAKGMIAEGKKICIELSVRQECENCAYALQCLAKMGLDIFGKDQAHFCFQGGPSGAKAFLPEQFASAATFGDE